MLTLVTQLLAACGIHQPLETARNVSLEKYAGKWYEIASFPTTFQKGCTCTSAEYGITQKGYVTVTNRCKRNGKMDGITGKAFPVDGGKDGKLKVQFFFPFRAHYWIIELADDYSYALVGHPNRDYLWILCREKTMDENIYNSLLIKAQAKGFDISRIKRTEQNCN